MVSQSDLLPIRIPTSGVDWCVLVIIFVVPISVLGIGGGSIGVEFAEARDRNDSLTMFVVENHLNKFESVRLPNCMEGKHGRE
jgi:hypothetical protein